MVADHAGDELLRYGLPQLGEDSWVGEVSAGFGFDFLRGHVLDGLRHLGRLLPQNLF